MREVIHCLIVDDEPPMVQRLERMFERWAQQRLPYKLVGAAYSGDEGIELAERLKPDLILTDIVMPGKNGIEMIRELRERDPRTEFIVLSAYSDFEYAKQAIAIGVFEYLVKVPLREREVLAALDKARSNLLARKEKEQRLQSLSGSVKGDSHRMRKQLLEELLRGDISVAAMERRSREYAQGFQPRGYGCFVARLDDEEAFRAEYSPADRNALRYGMLNIMEELLQASGGAYVCELSPDSAVGFASLRTVGAQAYEEEASRLAEEIQRGIQTYLRVSVSVGVGNRHHGWDEAITAFGEAKEALADAFYAGFGTTVTPRRRLAYDDYDAKRLFERFEAALDRLAPSADGAELESLLQLLPHCRVAPSRLLGYMDDWLSRLRRKMLPAGGGPASAAALPVTACAHLRQLTDRLRREWEELASRAERTSLRPEMAKAIMFVEERLQEPLSLGSVAEHIHLNPTYVSELFKRELGINFTDYVSKRRIERAIELLRKRPYSNQELANAVGIPNEKYFCTLFKKITGTTPRKFEPGGGRA